MLNVQDVQQRAKQTCEISKEINSQKQKTNSHDVPDIMGISCGSLQIILKEDLNMHLSLNSFHAPAHSFVCAIIAT
jgi:hypothetical protein